VFFLHSEGSALGIALYSGIKYWKQYIPADRSNLLARCVLPHCTCLPITRSSHVSFPLAEHERHVLIRDSFPGLFTGYSVRPMLFLHHMENHVGLHIFSAFWDLEAVLELLCHNPYYIKPGSCTEGRLHNGKDKLLASCVGFSSEHCFFFLNCFPMLSIKPRAPPHSC
jgi:hypothetical protein